MKTDRFSKTLTDKSDSRFPYGIKSKPFFPILCFHSNIKIANGFPTHHSQRKTKEKMKENVSPKRYQIKVEVDFHMDPNQNHSISNIKLCMLSVIWDDRNNSRINQQPDLHVRLDGRANPTFRP